MEICIRISAYSYSYKDINNLKLIETLFYKNIIFSKWIVFPSLCYLFTTLNFSVYIMKVLIAAFLTLIAILNSKFLIV